MWFQQSVRYLSVISGAKHTDISLFSHYSQEKSVRLIRMFFFYAKYNWFLFIMGWNMTMTFLMIYPAESDQSFSVLNPSVLYGSPFTPLNKEFLKSNCDFFFLQLHDINSQLRCEFISRNSDFFFLQMQVYFSELRLKKSQNCEKSKCLFCFLFSGRNGLP